MSPHYLLVLKGVAPYTHTKYKGWELAEIMKSIITNFKSIDKRLKSDLISGHNQDTKKLLPFDDQKGFLSLPYCTLSAVACLKSMSFGITA